MHIQHSLKKVVFGPDDVLQYVRWKSNHQAVFGALIIVSVFWCGLEIFADWLHS